MRNNKEYDSPIDCNDEHNQLLTIASEILLLLKDEPDWYQKELLAKELKYYMSEEQEYGNQKGYDLGVSEREEDDYYDDEEEC